MPTGAANTAAQQRSGRHEGLETASRLANAQVALDLASLGRKTGNGRRRFLRPFVSGRVVEGFPKAVAAKVEVLATCRGRNDRRARQGRQQRRDVAWRAAEPLQILR